MHKADPGSFGYDGDALRRAGAQMQERGGAAGRVVVAGRVISQWGDTASKIQSHSVRESLSSALYGLAVEDGRMDLDATLGELGVDDRRPLTEPEKHARVRDLLAARSGVYLKAGAETPFVSRTRPERGSHPPGSHFSYSNFDFNALEAVLLQVGGESIGTLFERSIARPTGMQDFVAEDVFTNGS